MVVLSISGDLRGLAHRSAAGDDVIKAAAEWLVFGAAIVLLGLYVHRDGLRAGLAAVVGVGVGLVVGSLIGSLYVEQRPFVAGHFAPLFAHAADASFPSDHLTALGAVFGGALFASRAWALLAAALAAAVALARVIAGVHYVGDVLGGFALGAAAAILAWWLLAPLMPVVDRVDTELQARRLRPRLPRAEGGQPAR